MTFDPKKLEQFPTKPGVYLMKDGHGEVLYVGKAKNIRNRVRQYFLPGRDGRVIVPYLVSKVEAIESIVVFSEKEALLLENTLIKQHQPHYNALLKDDKGFIALKISLKDKWPSVKLVRYKGQPEPDGIYFGPYTSAYAARQTLDLLNRLFPLRQCSDKEMARRVRPCLLYQMKRCAGPCVEKCTKEEYDQHLQRTIKFLKGQDREVLKDLYDEMERLSEAMEYEKAAQLLRTIRHIEHVIESQHVDRPLGRDADALGLYRHGSEVVLSQLLFRSGKLIGSRHYPFKQIGEADEELLSSFIVQHYEEGMEMPLEILVPMELPDVEVLEELLKGRNKRKVDLHFPQRGEKKALLDMAQVNAEAHFKMQKGDQELNEQLLLDLQETVSLSRFPKVIECFDTSHTAGTEHVACMVAFVDGKKDSKRYRLFRLHIDGMHDDYAAMREVLTRRYKRAKEENALPDLVVVDGGKGQLNAALKVFEELNVTGVDVIGLAKEQGRHDKGMTGEQIFLPEKKEPILLKKNSPILFLLQKMRDEAHRFVINYHRKSRSKKVVKSALDDIPGIGPAKRKALLKHFGSVAKIKQATEEELRQVKGITAANAQVIVASLTKGP